MTLIGLVRKTQENQVELVDFLVEKGADVNRRNNKGATPLHYAAYMGNIHIVATLLKAGGDTKICDSRGETPIAIARKKGNSELAKQLLQGQGNDPQESKDSPLNQILIQAALSSGIIKGKELGFIPEAEAVIQGGSALIFQALKDVSAGKHTYDIELVRRCCCYLFGKGVEAVFAWGNTTDGKFSICYDPKHLTDMDLHAEVLKKHIPTVQKACALGEALYDAHMEWCEQRVDSGSGAEIDLAGEVRQLLLMSSRLGLSYALENKFHELA